METWAGLNGDPVAGQAGVWQCDRLIFLATRGPIGDALGTHWGRTGDALGTHWGERDRVAGRLGGQLL